MDAAFEQRVRERAYDIWVAAGKADGLADLHWFSAEMAVMAEHKAAPADMPMTTALPKMIAKPRKAGSSKRAVKSKAA